MEIKRAVAIFLLAAVGLDARTKPAAGHVCLIGYAKLKAYFDERGLPFEPKLVTAHKLTYCHVYSEPSQPGPPWLAQDMEIVPDPRAPSRRLLFFGDQSRKTLGRAVRDDEFAFLLRVEFSVEEAIHVPVPAIPMREAVVFGPGNVAHVLAAAVKVSALLTRLGFTITPMTQNRPTL